MRYKEKSALLFALRRIHASAQYERDGLDIFSFTVSSEILSKSNGDREVIFRASPWGL